jgi:tRNA G37 N-methylase Trm5
MRTNELVVAALRSVRFRGKARLLGPLAPRSGRHTARVFGYRMTLDLSDHIERMIYLGAFEREETGLVLRRLRPGMTFLDVGANVGYFTFLAARRVGPLGRVIAVEPSPHAFARLDETARVNGLTVERHAIGLSDRDGQCTL